MKNQEELQIIIEKAYKNNKKVKLIDILNLNLDEKEYEAVIDTLQKNNISIELDENITVEEINYSEVNELFNQFCNQIKKIKLLTIEEEKRLLMAYKNTGDKNIRKEIVESNLRLVIWITRLCYKYKNNIIDVMDLIQEGTKGLIMAIEKFDFYKECKLSTYAIWWIRQYIIRYMHNNARTIRIPSYMITQNSKIENYTQNKYKETGEYPSYEQMSLDIGLEKKQISFISKTITQNVISLEESILKNNIEDDFKLIDIIPSGEKDIEDEVIDNMTADEIVNVARKILSENQFIAFSMGFGLINEVNDVPYPRKNNEIAKCLGDITSERVRQLQERAIEKIKLYIEKGSYRKPRKKVK